MMKSSDDGGHFWAIFGHFYPISPEIFAIVQSFPSYIYGTPQVMSGLVNNHGKRCQMSCIIFHDWTFLEGMCEQHCECVDIEEESPTIRPLNLDSGCPDIKYSLSSGSIIIDSWCKPFL